MIIISSSSSSSIAKHRLPKSAADVAPRTGDLDIEQEVRSSKKSRAYNNNNNNNNNNSSST